MIIKLLSTTIPDHWEIIKHATTIAGEVDEEDLQPYLFDLLHSLLSDKAQCWLDIDKNRSIKSVLITRIVFDKVTKRKQLLLQTFYPFQMTSIDLFKEIQSLLIGFAENEQCSQIIFSSSDREAWKIAELLDYQEKSRNFIFETGGLT